jgi:acyl-homoserine-lactone acylase
MTARRPTTRQPIAPKGSPGFIPVAAGLLSILAIVAAVLIAGTSKSASGFTRAADETDLLWDKYGVPHIFATTREGMFHAHGYAQMQNQANLLLTLYGESRGKAAEYWGQSGLALDRWLALNAVPERAKAWYDAQTPTFRKYMDEFARGINDYAKDHPDKIRDDLKVVLPVTGVDVIGHPLRVVYYGYIAPPASASAAGTAAGGGGRGGSPPLAGAGTGQYDANDPAIPGSNTWSIGPSKSASGSAMLIINPHLNWNESFYRYMTVHLVGPNYDLYGAPQVGFPVPVVGFNRRTGWGRTVNTLQTRFFYKLTVANGQYMFDGKPRAFEHEVKTVKVKQANGSFTLDTVVVRRSIHGPVVFDRNGVVVAMRVAGIDRPKLLEQWFKMGEAQNLNEFKDALRMGAVPMWNANYADDQGHIMLVDNGLIARRTRGDDRFWASAVPGDSSWSLFTDYLKLEELPTSTDPASGWNQNANEAPWAVTLPPLDRTKFPAYVAPAGDNQPAMRTLSSIRLLTEDAKISFEQLVAKKHSTRMELAERTLPDMFAAAKNGSANAKAAAAALAVLEKWNRNADVDSKGAVLFQAFADGYLNQGLAGKMRVRYDINRPNETATGLADPEAALAALATTAAQVQQTYGSLEVPYGDVYRFRQGTVEVPGNGGAGNSGLFRTITFGTREGNKRYASHGETIVCAIEFARAQQARCLLGYGNSTQPGSPHLTDQLPFMSRKELLPVWRERKDVEANLEGKIRFSR